MCGCTFRRCAPGPEGDPWARMALVGQVAIRPTGPRRGRTIHTADARVAGTARSHGAVLVTHNLSDFPMRDLRVESLAEGPTGG